MHRDYRYQVTGTGGNNGAFEVKGEIRGDLVDIFDLALGASFHLLTGQPPIRPDHRARILQTCGGPYKVRRIVIELDE